MNVFVTGATGVLGRRVVRRLVADGHAVRALARSDANVDALTRLGATPFPGGLFDAAAMRKAVVGTDAVLHLATHIPKASRAVRARGWDETDRIRDVGTPLLVDAALDAGVGTVVYPSITFGYEDCGDAWIDEDVAYGTSAVLDATLAGEQATARFGADGRRGVSLRLGFFIGPDTSFTADTVRAARFGIAAVLGPPDTFQSSIWLDDAAAAVVAALDAPSGVYNVVDDEPLRRGDLAAAIAAGLGKRRLRLPPAFLVRAMVPSSTRYILRSNRVSNARFRAATGWRPEVTSAAGAWARIGGARRAQ